MKLCNIKKSVVRTLGPYPERDVDYHIPRKKSVGSAKFIGGPFDGLLRPDRKKPLELLYEWDLPSRLQPKRWDWRISKYRYLKQSDGTYLFDGVNP